MKKILGLGNALVDALIQIDNDDIFRELHLHKEGMTLIEESTHKKNANRLKSLSFKRSTGGSAGNALSCVAALGGDASFVGRIGADENGAFYEAESKQRGVKFIPLRDPSLPTGVANTFISDGGLRTFATYLGAAALLEAKHLDAAMPQDVDYVFIEGYLVQNHELMERAVELSHQRGAQVCLDLASWNIVESEHAFFERLLSNIDIVFANEDEARAMTGRIGEEAARLLAQTCRIAIVKCGPRGAVAVEGDQCVSAPATPVAQVLDTTGAGDFFAGGFLHRHALGGSLKDCLCEGAACAGEVIQVIGTQLPDTTWQRLRAESAARCSTH